MHKVIAHRGRNIAVEFQKLLIINTIEGYDVRNFTDNIEEPDLRPIKPLLSIDVFADKKICILADMHAGTGCEIGFTCDLGDKVILKLDKHKDIDFRTRAQEQQVSICREASVICKDITVIS